jgi:hypothetical protein
MTLSAEQIQRNYDSFIANIEIYITSPRREKLLEYYNSIQEILVMSPAAARESNHNCMPGGYVDHVNRVVSAALDLHKLWSNYGTSSETYTEEELVFAAINHDLGKLGLGNKPNYLPNDNDWQVKNQGAFYKINTELPFSTISDRSLFILQSIGVPVTHNEYLGIKLHDGLYEESNKAYLISYQPESRLRTTLPIILHQADMLASRVEWERDWLPKLNTPQQTKPKPQASRMNAAAAKQEAMARVGKTNPGLLAALKNI